ncbi:hypothetical protein KZZ52_13525 [Dactylosporangium sp. AC04546]|uniref:hypothetical protein n=1 Tax=Dactylosporangium sp. AC04546 TaxID=2862460 RepID=UPI001EDDEF09|nr:hypothetical protein [Dactylosporangium sp. AC04546]WVK86347.1 hypothetical protein KZZ52_13525 [Dactylosporangium sp. AC04546]
MQLDEVARRYLLVAGAVLAFAAVGVAAAAGLPAVPDKHPAPKESPPQASAAAAAPASPVPVPSGPGGPMRALPVLPVVDGDPSAVGAPWELHLGLDVLPFAARVVRRAQAAQGEELRLEAGDPGTGVTVRLGRTTAHFEPLVGAERPVTVSGRAGVAAGNAVRWQPADGLWAQVSGRMPEVTALAVAGGVRVDRTYRCSVPFRLPARVALFDRCALTFTDGNITEVALTVRDGESYARVTTERGRLARGAVTEVLGGHPATVADRVIVIDTGAGLLRLAAEGVLDQAWLRQLAAGVVWVGGAPGDWPADPLQ